MGKFLFLVILLSLISVLPLLNKGLPPTHDGEYHVIRFYEFNKTLMDGNIYPRWAPDLNNGFGLPLFNYVYPLPNYLSSLTHSFGFSFIDSFKLNMFFATLIGAVFFYLWSRIYWGRLGGLVSSAFYVYAPYRLLDIYIRGSVGEVWALSLFPAFLWSITKFIREGDSKFAILSSLFLALLILSHNILALMFSIFGIFYMIFLTINSKNKMALAFKNFIIVVLGVGLSSVFWLPALFEKQYVKGLEVFDFSSHFPEFYQLIIPSWGSGFSADSLQNQLSFQIGIANLLAVFLSILTLLLIKKNKNRKVIAFFVASFFIVFFMMLKVSYPIWQAVPFMDYFQFPWRFLSLAILITSFLAGASIYLWKGKAAVLMITIAIFLGIGYSKPPHYFPRDDNYYITRSNFIDGTNSPGNAFNTKWFNSKLNKEPNKLTILKGKGEVQLKEIKPTDYKFYVQTETVAELLVNTAYFPGWKVSTNNKNIPTRITKDGRFSFTLPKGDQNVRIKLESTSSQKSAFFIFLGSVITLVLLSKSSLFATIKKVHPV